MNPWETPLKRIESWCAAHRMPKVKQDLFEFDLERSTCVHRDSILVFLFRPADPRIRNQKQREQRTCVHRGPIFWFLFKPADQKIRGQKRLERNTCVRRGSILGQNRLELNTCVHRKSITTWAKYMCSRRLDFLICVPANWPKTGKNKHDLSEVHVFTEAQHYGFCSSQLTFPPGKNAIIINEKSNTTWAKHMCSQILGILFF